MRRLCAGLVVACAAALAASSTAQADPLNISVTVRKGVPRVAWSLPVGDEIAGLEVSKQASVGADGLFMKPLYRIGSLAYSSITNNFFFPNADDLVDPTATSWRPDPDVTPIGPGTFYVHVVAYSDCETVDDICNGDAIWSNVVRFVTGKTPKPPPKPTTSPSTSRPASLSVSDTFYSDYVHFDVHYRIYPPAGACVKDKYGNYIRHAVACTQFAEKSADWDIRVWQTTGGWRIVHSSREFGIDGRGSIEVFYTLDLHLPAGCYGQHWRRDFKAVFRVFSPLTSHALKSTSRSFYVSC